MAVKISKQMTRIVLIGTLDKYEYQTEPFTIGKGVIKVGETNTRFSIFNKDKEGAVNPHTKASDLVNYPIGQRIYVTGQDNRSYSEEKEVYYEDVSGWDYREAEDEEIDRWVFVYVADIVQIDDDGMVLSYTNYKDKEMLYQITFNNKTKIPLGLDVGDRVKCKGIITNGRVEDFFGDGEFATIRTAAEIKIENTAAEIAEDAAEVPEATDGALWG